jgi:hypothetical protein
MLRYSPPKSQVWGHQVGRLSAAEIVDRCLRFLNDECVVIGSQLSELMIGWNDAQHSFLSEVASEIGRALGNPSTANEAPSVGGQIFRQRRWPFSADKLQAVAGWFDNLREAIKTRDVVAQSSIIWIFAWRDEPQPLRPLESAGGMFGVHLGQPHRITTAFSFRSLDRYEKIKESLAILELAELSGRHLRPKVGVGKRKAK